MLAGAECPTEDAMLAAIPASVKTIGAVSGDRSTRPESSAYAKISAMKIASSAIAARCYLARAAASAEVMTGSTSKSTRSAQAAIHWSSSSRRSVCITW